MQRRALLLGGAAVGGGVALGLIGQQQGWWTSAVLGGSDPSGAIRRVARRSVGILVVGYGAALDSPDLATPGNQPRLQAYRDHHLAHLGALGGDAGTLAEAPRPGQPPPPDSNFFPLLPVLPADPADIPGYFAAAEQQQVDLLSTGVRTSPDGGLARLLALLVASDSAHVAGWLRG